MFPVILIVCLVNGIASPVAPIVVALAPVWLPEFVPLEPEFVFHGASLIIAFGTMFVGGVPAALWERFNGQDASDTTSMMIWLASVTALSLPAFLRLLA